MLLGRSYIIVHNIIHFLITIVYIVYLFLHIVVNFFTTVSGKKTRLNRGQILAAVVEASGLNKEEAANKAGYSRSAYYKHVENPNLDYHILIAYGRALRHDFTDEFPDMPKYILEEPEEIYGKPKTVEEAIRIAEQWKNKYLDLLEKYNKMIEERIQKK